MNATIAHSVQASAPITTAVAGRKKTDNSINVVKITRKPHRRLGRTIMPTPETNREYNAEIVKNKSIRLYGWTRGTKFGYDVDRTGKNPWTQPFDRVFHVGDTVEYDSFNLAYTGKIVAIGEKTVSVQPEHRSKVVRMSLYDFVSRNYDLDLDALRKRNAEWYVCLLKPPIHRPHDLPIVRFFFAAHFRHFVILVDRSRNLSMAHIVNSPHTSYLLSETPTRRVYRFNGAVLIDVKVDGNWLTVAVL